MIQPPQRRRVLFDHDGGVDDLLSLMMLLAMPHIDLIGIIVTPADCFLRPAVSATLKILRFFERLDIEVSAGTLSGVNPFPRAWRAHAYAIDAFPILNELKQDRDRVGADTLPAPVAEAGHEFIVRKLREAERPVTVLVTGPVTNLAAALAFDPRIEATIEEVVWMGGAINVTGNVRDYEHDGSAEWNIYWDPPAAYDLWKADVPLTLFPLDVTNQISVTGEFLQQLAQQRRYPLSDLAGQCWALTVGVISSYEYIYHMWDTLTTGYLGAPQYIGLRHIRTEIVASGPGAGRTVQVESGGKLIDAANSVDVDGFLNYVLRLLQR